MLLSREMIKNCMFNGIQTHVLLAPLVTCIKQTSIIKQIKPLAGPGLEPQTQEGKSLSFSVFHALDLTAI